MKILITGAKGQLGQSINKLAMQYQDFEFTFTDYSELDITNQGQLDQLFEDAGYDYCINCAAYTAVDKAEQEVEQAYRINADAVKLLAKTCSRNQVVLIHISTDFVFDGKKQTPYTEEDIPNPISIYGKSKLQGDKRIQECLNEHFIIRTSWVYSEFGGNFV